MCFLIRCKMGPRPLRRRRMGGRGRHSLVHVCPFQPSTLRDGLFVSKRGAGPSRLEGFMTFHAAVHREQMQCPQTGFHATRVVQPPPPLQPPRGSGRDLTFHGCFSRIGTEGSSEGEEVCFQLILFHHFSFFYI